MSDTNRATARWWHHRIVPYGNEHMRFGEGFASSKDGIEPGNNKSIARREAKASRRAKDKAAVRRDLEDVA